MSALPDGPTARESQTHFKTERNLNCKEDLTLDMIQPDCVLVLKYGKSALETVSTLKIQPKTYLPAPMHRRRKAEEEVIPSLT